MNKVYPFTVMSKEGGNYFDLRRSAQKWDWPLQAHFAGDPTGDAILFSKSYDKFMSRKHLIMRDVIAGAVLKGYERFVYLDGWDTIITGPFKELPFPGNLCFGVEGPSAYPEEEYGDFFHHQLSPNCGVIWGMCAAYLNRCPTYEGFDQLLWHRELMNSLQDIWLDERRQVAVNLFGIHDQDTWGWEAGRIVYRPTGSKPLVLHANGKWGFPAMSIPPRHYPK